MSNEALIDWNSVFDVLHRAGAFVSIPGAMSSGWLVATVDELRSFLDDPELFHANQLGMTRGEYTEFVRTEGVLQCDGQTRAGERCKNLIPQVLLYDPERWLALKRGGWFCHCHQEVRNG